MIMMSTSIEEDITGDQEAGGEMMMIEDGEDITT